MTDPLLDAILADPENDDPRLVWADREGGDRGELVIVQCAIAARDRSGLARDELRRLYARERALLARARLWPEIRRADDDDFTRTRTRFERGFVVHRPVRLDLLAAHDDLFAEAPLLRSIDLPVHLLENEYGMYRPDWGPIEAQVARAFEHLPPGRITHVDATPLTRSDAADFGESRCNELLATLAKSAAGRSLRGLHIHQPTVLECLAPFEALEDLHVEGTFPISRIPELAPRKLRRLGLYGNGCVRGEPLRTFLSDPYAAHLTALDLPEDSLGSCLRDEDAFAIASSPNLSGLTSLGLSGADFSPRGAEALAASPFLAGIRTLELGSRYRPLHLDLFAEATFAPTLRELRLVDSAPTPSALPFLLQFPSLERLVFGVRSKDESWFRPLEDVIPCVTPYLLQ